MDHREWVFKAFDECRQHFRLSLGKVLDVGCRDEETRKPLEERGFEWKGLDLSPQSPNVLKGRMEEPHSDLYDDSFDVIFCCHSFEHCERPVDALRQFHRYLKRGGYVFIAGPPPNEHHITDGDDDHIMVLGELQLAKLLVYAGFVNVKSWTYPGDKENNDTVCAVGEAR